MHSVRNIDRLVYFMAKRKASVRKSVPSAFLYLGIASLSVNALMLVGMIAGTLYERNGHFDYAVINEGINRMCSAQFRDRVEKDYQERGATANEKGLQLALIDYPCAKNGAGDYYKKGYNEYVRSLGLNTLK